MDTAALRPIRILVLLSLCWLGGCGASQDAEFVKASNDTNLKKMGSVYQLYASRFGYRGPKSKDELLSFLKTNEKIASNLELMGLDREKIDDYFVSENDGQEFAFRWGVFINPDLERSKEPLVFERQGKDGIRLVMLSNRKILEVDNERKYQDLLRGKVDRNEAKTELEKLEEAAVD
jgi:hypothetical protein